MLFILKTLYQIFERIYAFLLPEKGVGSVSNDKLVSLTCFKWLCFFFASTIGVAAALCLTLL